LDQRHLVGQGDGMVQTGEVEALDPAGAAVPNLIAVGVYGYVEHLQLAAEVADAPLQANGAAALEIVGTGTRDETDAARVNRPARDVADVGDAAARAEYEIRVGDRNAGEIRANFQLLAVPQSPLVLPVQV
jgi:hypothetical protein